MEGSRDSASRLHGYMRATPCAEGRAWCVRTWNERLDNKCQGCNVSDGSCRLALQFLCVFMPFDRARAAAENIEMSKSHIFDISIFSARGTRAIERHEHDL